MFAYEQCLLVLGHHPDIWYEAAQYLEQSSKLLAEKGVRRMLIAFLFSYLIALTRCTVVNVFSNNIQGGSEKSQAS